MELQQEAWKPYLDFLCIRFLQERGLVLPACPLGVVHTLNECVHLLRLLDASLVLLL